MLGMGIDRAIPVVIHQHHLVEHKRNEADMIELARRFAKEMNIDESKLLGVNRSQQVIEADYLEVMDAETAKPATPTPE